MIATLELEGLEYKPRPSWASYAKCREAINEMRRTLSNMSDSSAGQARRAILDTVAQEPSQNPPSPPLGPWALPRSAHGKAPMGGAHVDPIWQHFTSPMAGAHIDPSCEGRGQ